jgi:hypothetical protein
MYNTNPLTNVLKKSKLETMNLLYKILKEENYIP